MEVIFLIEASETPSYDAFFSKQYLSWEACFSWSPSSICITQVFLQLGLCFKCDKFNQWFYPPFCMGDHLHHNIIRGVYVMDIEWFGPKRYNLDDHWWFSSDNASWSVWIVWPGNRALFCFHLFIQLFQVERMVTYTVVDHFILAFWKSFNILKSAMETRVSNMLVC